MFKNMGGNIPGGNLMGGNFPGGSFPDTTENIFVEDHFFFNFKNFLFKNVHRGQSSKIEMWSLNKSKLFIGVVPFWVTKGSINLVLSCLTTINLHHVF